MVSKILVVDDDRDIANLICDILEDEGFETFKAFTGDTALEKIQNQRFDLIILDIMLPNLSGTDILKKVRDDIKTPILLLTAKSKSIDKVLGFELGADDYITKPFDTYELAARVKAHIRRSNMNNSNVDDNSISFKGIVLNRNSYKVAVDGKTIELSTKEFQLLEYLMINANIILTRDKIYDSIWGYEEFGDINTVTVHIKKLREKIDPNNKYIKTVWGTGYKFVGER